MGEPYVIISLKWSRARDKYVSFWRPRCAGYCWPLSWAGGYTEAEARRIDDAPDSDAIAVPMAAAMALAIDPQPGWIDGDAGPVVPFRRLSKLVAARLPPPENSAADGGATSATKAGSGPPSSNQDSI